MACSKRQLALWISSVANLCLLVTSSGVRGDVPDDVVWTELHKNVRIGERAVLTCQFRGSPLAVYWKKGDDPRSAPNLVSWIPTDDVIGKCERQRPCEVMEMNGNRSLVIKDVGISEEGRYICRVANYKGKIIHNFTDVSLYAPPEEPYPVIDGCISRSSVSNPEPCRVLTHKTITLTCSVTNYYPGIELFFLHGTKQITTIHQEEQTNVDSTKNKSISIEAGPSETLYICVASDVPGSRERKAASILVESFSSIPSERIPVIVETMREGCPVTITAIIASSIVLLGAALVFVWWKWTHRHTNNGGIQELGNDEPESNLMLDGVKQSTTRLKTQQTSIQRREGTLEKLEALRRKETTEAHLYMTVQVVTEDQFYGHQGNDLFDSNSIWFKEFKIMKSASLADGLDMLSQSMGFRPDQIRIWPFSQRVNHTSRPTFLENNDPVKQMNEVADGDSVWTVFLETQDPEAHQVCLPSFDRESDVLLFLKLYDPKTKSLSFCGHVNVPITTKIQALVPLMNERAGFPESTELILYEEVKPNLTMKIKDLSQQIDKSIPEVMDGDILVFQRDDPEKMQYDLPTAKDYFWDLFYREEVTFCDKTNPRDPGFTLILSNKMNYFQFAKAVAQHLDTDVMLLQFFKGQGHRDGPGHPLRCTFEGSLRDLLPPTKSRQPRKLYYQMKSSSREGL